MGNFNYAPRFQQAAAQPIPFAVEAAVREGSVDGERLYLDGVVTGAETRDNTFDDMPPDSYSIKLEIKTAHDPQAHVFLEVSTRMGRSEYTCDRQQWQLALESLKKIDPAADDNTLAYPERLVGKPCRLLGVWREQKGRWSYYLVKQGEGGSSDKPAPVQVSNAAERLARMRSVVPSKAAPAEAAKWSRLARTDNF